MVGSASDATGGAYGRKFARKHRGKSPLMLGEVGTAQRFGGLRGGPTLYLFGRDGRVREMYEGFRSNEVLEKEILGLL